MAAIGNQIKTALVFAGADFVKVGTAANLQSVCDDSASYPMPCGTTHRKFYRYTDVFD